MLPDYVADIFNHAHPSAVVHLPVAPVDEARREAQAFTDSRGAELRIVDHAFNYDHPLSGMQWE
jgi:hypothetical protein